MTSGNGIQSENNVYFLVELCDDMLIHINKYLNSLFCSLETNQLIYLIKIKMIFNLATSDEKNEKK